MSDGKILDADAGRDLVMDKAIKNCGGDAEKNDANAGHRKKWLSFTRDARKRLTL